MESDDNSNINDSFSYNFFQNDQEEEPFDPMKGFDFNYNHSNVNVIPKKDSDTKLLLINPNKGVSTLPSEIKNTNDESKETVGPLIPKKKFAVPRFVVTREDETQTEDDFSYSNYTVSVIGSRIIISLKNSI